MRTANETTVHAIYMKKEAKKQHRKPHPSVFLLTMQVGF